MVRTEGESGIKDSITLETAFTSKTWRKTESLLAGEPENDVLVSCHPENVKCKGVHGAE